MLCCKISDSFLSRCQVVENLSIEIALDLKKSCTSAVVTFSVNFKLYIQLSGKDIIKNFYNLSDKIS